MQKLFKIIKNNKSGFSLVEILIVIVVIAALISISIYLLSNARQKSDDARRTSDIETIRTALGLYFIDNGYYPEAITEGESITGPSGEEYLREVPTAPSISGIDCTSEGYTYTRTANMTSYSIDYCLASLEPVSGCGPGDCKALPDERVVGCTPDCDGKECGDDGCGGSCGTCSEGRECSADLCIIDSYTKLLLHFDGTDNGVVFTDSSPVGRAVSRINAVTKTGTKYFGTASGYFDGNGDYLTSIDHADWDIYGEDFTVDFWINFTRPANNYFQVFKHANTSSPWYGHSVTYENRDSQSATAWYRRMYMQVTNSNGVFRTYSLTDPSGAGWTHIAVTKQGTNYKIYVNGTLENTVEDTGNPDNAGALYIGTNAGTAGFFHGYLDELRFSKGIARWTTNFAPPTSAY
ncbi:MAG: LamG domain-containing protein [bacterium]